MRNLLIFLSILTLGLILLLKGPDLFQSDTYVAVNESPLVTAPVERSEPVVDASEQITEKSPAISPKKVPLRRKSKAKRPRAKLIKKSLYSNNNVASNSNLPQAPDLKPDFSGADVQDGLLDQMGNAALNQTDPQNERWISSLSGPGAQLSMGTERKMQNCEREGVYCPVNRKQEALLVGAAVKVSPGTQVKQPAFQGRMNQGDYNAQTPGLSLE